MVLISLLLFCSLFLTGSLLNVNFSNVALARHRAGDGGENDAVVIPVADGDIPSPTNQIGDLPIDGLPSEANNAIEEEKKDENAGASDPAEVTPPVEVVGEPENPSIVSGDEVVENVPTDKVVDEPVENQPIADGSENDIPPPTADIPVDVDPVTGHPTKKAKSTRRPTSSKPTRSPVTAKPTQLNPSMVSEDLPECLNLKGSPLKISHKAGENGVELVVANCAPYPWNWPSHVIVPGSKEFIKKYSPIASNFNVNVSIFLEGQKHHPCSCDTFSFSPSDEKSKESECGAENSKLCSRSKLDTPGSSWSHYDIRVSIEAIRRSDENGYAYLSSYDLENETSDSASGMVTFAMVVAMIALTAAGFHYYKKPAVDNERLPLLKSTESAGVSRWWSRSSRQDYQRIPEADSGIAMGSSV